MAAAVASTLSVCGLPLGLRSYEPGDRSRILSTWVSEGWSTARCGREVYLRGEPRLAERLVAAHPPIVVCSTSVPSTILGWACCSPTAMHFAHVVPELRRRGLLRCMLVAAWGDYPARVQTTHRLPFGSTRFSFDPYLLVSA